MKGDYFVFIKRPHLIYQNSNITLRLSRQTDIVFIFLVCNSLKGNKKQRKVKKSEISSCEPLLSS